jgi:hypothetical protein
MSLKYHNTEMLHQSPKQFTARARKSNSTKSRQLSGSKFKALISRSDSANDEEASALISEGETESNWAFGGAFIMATRDIEKVGYL